MSWDRPSANLCKAVLAALTGQLIHLEHCTYKMTGKLLAQTNQLPLELIPPSLALCPRRPRVTHEVMTVTQSALPLRWVRREGQSHGPAQAATPSTHLRRWGRFGSLRDHGGRTCQLGRQRLQLPPERPTPPAATPESPHPGPSRHWEGRPNED